MSDKPIINICLAVGLFGFILSLIIAMGTFTGPKNNTEEVPKIETLDNATRCELLNSDEFYKYINDNLHIDIKNAKEPVYMVVTQYRETVRSRGSFGFAVTSNGLAPGYMGSSRNTINHEGVIDIRYISETSPTDRFRSTHTIYYENFIVKNLSTGKVNNLGNYPGNSTIVFIPKGYTDDANIIESLKTLGLRRTSELYTIEIE